MKYILLLLSLGSCSSLPEKVSPLPLKQAYIQPASEDTPEHLHEAITTWIKRQLQKKGYGFSEDVHAKTLVMVDYRSDQLHSDDPDVEKTAEPYEGEGLPEAGPKTRHQVIVTIEDNSCSRRSTTLSIELETDTPDPQDIIPELLQALEQSFHTTYGC